MTTQRYVDIPLSEDTEKFDGYWTREQCIAELRRVAEIDEEKVVTRNYFRVHSRIKESVWNRHFGTFLEFKRGANIILSRHQHRHEKAIAKHSSTEAFKRMNEEKSGYAEAYLRPDGKRFQTIIVGTDIHDVDCDSFWNRVFIDTIARVQPEKVVIPGDLFDLPEFSKYSQDPREWNVLDRIQWVHRFLGEVRDAAPNAELTLVEGNHEFRLLRHLSEATPALRAVLSDLHGFTVPKLLGLDEYEVNYIARADLGTFTERDIKEELNRNYVIFHDCFLLHHFPQGEKMGYPGAHGHHHRHFVNQHYSPTFGAYEWHQLGCGHRRLANYCAGEEWGNGFLIAHIDTAKKHVAHEYIQVRDFCVVGGKYYFRNNGE